MQNRCTTADDDYRYYDSNYDYNYFFKDLNRSMGNSSEINLVPYFVCDTTLDLVGFLLFAVVIYGVYSSRKISPIFVFLSTVFCMGTLLLLIQDLGLNILTLDYILYPPHGGPKPWWITPSLAIASLNVCVTIFLTLLQALMTLNRLCAVTLVTKYQHIFTFRRTALVVAIFFIISIPPLPIFLLRIGGCYAAYYPERFSFNFVDYDFDEGATCHTIFKHGLLFFCSISLSFIIIINFTVLFLQYRRRNSSVAVKQPIRSELQFVVITVVLALVSGAEIVLHMACGFLSAEIYTKYSGRILNISMAYIYLITIGFINKRIRTRIIEGICFWRRNKQRRPSNVFVRPAFAENQNMEAALTKRKLSAV